MASLVTSLCTKSLRRVSLLLLTVLLFVVPATSWGAPFSKYFNFVQPDHETIVLWGEGDDFHAIFETTEGYAVVFDNKKGAYFYATRSEDGKQLVSTGVLAHKQAPANLVRHIRLDPEAASAAAQARRRQWETETGLSARWALLKSQNLHPAASVTTSGAQTSPPATSTVGTKIGLTLLIDFPDVPATIGATEISSFLNGASYAGYENNGSVRQYFGDVSGGRLDYSNVVTMYVRMTKPKTYYDNTSRDCGAQGRLLINDALAILKARSDYASDILPTFNTLTTDGAGDVVAFNVYFAGSDSGVWSYGLWPHSWVLATGIPLGNGKSVYSYQVTNVGETLELGTFCHENGHMLCGFPDLYDYGYDSVGGAGDFSLMGYGGSGKNPVEVDAYLKTAAGWATITNLDSSSNLVGTLLSAPTVGSDSFYRFSRPGVATEYFLLENRQKVGRDAGLPAAGVAVWHVDELGERDNQSLTPNQSHHNYELTLVQADNLWHFENYVNPGDARDLYYLGNGAAAYTNTIDEFSAPNTNWWDGSTSGMKLSSFGAPGTTMTFNIGVVSSKDFVITATPNVLTASQGEGASTSITVIANGGFSSDVALSVSGVPEGVTALLDKETITAGAGTAALAITIGQTAPVGTYTLKVTGGSGALTHDASIILTITPSPTYAVSGTVKYGSERGTPIAGAEVAIGEKITSTDRKGKFLITGVQVGTYPLSISKTGFYSYTDSSFNVGSDQRSLIFYLTPIPTYSISGTVRAGSATGPVLAGATVSIAGKSSITGKKGTFAVTGILAGSYPLTVSKSGYNSFTDPAFVVESSQSGLNLFLLPQP
ncbi:M6 family metalloprotease domain-containing protein [Geomonas propionica]|uniref:M6 family metalloprotease domain-containing protein n=1 Tax=Geomonas propionica TaxID=2798582 RepID=A0ABS0YMS7_9BACT|nr:M6 family metalloprotease domain-containing protein [Geomonas propionica]MBJ6799193.1 M6 family metalloprotease domain-containing protein [Geomonas propionica]